LADLISKSESGSPDNEQYWVKTMPQFLHTIVSRLQPVLFSALMVVLASGGGPLIILPESRSGEAQENAPLNERQEEFASQGRLDHERLMKLEQRRLAIIFEVPASSRLGHTQNAVLFAPSGHRLANGLLAPLTC
jgi:hypothetical protein